MRRTEAIEFGEQLAFDLQYFDSGLDDEVDISTSAGITRATLLAAVGDNVRFQLPTGWSAFRGRVLVIVGRRERRLMRDSANTIDTALPGSELSVVDGCGHGIPLQRPDWFNDRVVDWLQAV